MNTTIKIQKLSNFEYLYFRKNGKPMQPIGLAKIGDRFITQAIYNTAKAIAQQLGAELCLRKELSDRQRRKYVRIRIGSHSYYLKGIKRSA